MKEDDLRWPALPLEACEPTRATLHMWTQIVGKSTVGAQHVREPLVASSALCERTRPDDVTYSL